MLVFSGGYPKLQEITQIYHRLALFDPLVARVRMMRTIFEIH